MSGTSLTWRVTVTDPRPISLRRGVNSSECRSKTCYTSDSFNVGVPNNFFLRLHPFLSPSSLSPSSALGGARGADNTGHGGAFGGFGGGYRGRGRGRGGYRSRRGFRGNDDLSSSSDDDVINNNNNNNNRSTNGDRSYRHNTESKSGRNNQNKNKNKNNNNNNNNNSSEDDLFVLSLVSFPLSVDFKSILIHVELNCYNTRVQRSYSSIWKIKKFFDAGEYGYGYYDYDRLGVGPYDEAMLMVPVLNKKDVKREMVPKHWTVGKTRNLLRMIGSDYQPDEFVFECKINVLRVEKLDQRFSSQERARVFLNPNVGDLKQSKFKFAWQLDYFSVARFLDDRTGQLASNVFFGMFQLQMRKGVLVLQVCGMPKDAAKIAAKLKICVATAPRANILEEEIISTMVVLDYVDSTRVRLPTEENQKLLEILLDRDSNPNTRHIILCDIEIVHMYSEDKEILSNTFSSSAGSGDAPNYEIITNGNGSDVDWEDTEAKLTESQKKILDTVNDTFVWQIKDASVIRDLKEDLCHDVNQIDSQVFKLLGRKWYISIVKCFDKKRDDVRERRMNYGPGRMAIPANPQRSGVRYDGHGSRLVLEALKVRVHDVAGEQNELDGNGWKMTTRLLEIGVKKSESFDSKVVDHDINRDGRNNLRISVDDQNFRKLEKLTIRIDMTRFVEDIDNVYNMESLQKVESETQNFEECENWLKNVVKLPQYLKLFVKEGINDLDTIKLLTMESLHAMGIEKIGHKLKIIKCVKSL